MEMLRNRIAEQQPAFTRVRFAQSLLMPQQWTFPPPAAALRKAFFPFSMKEGVPNTQGTLFCHYIQKYLLFASRKGELFNPFLPSSGRSR